RWPCFYGIDTPNTDELLAANHSIEEMTAILGADSLAYISVDNLKKAIGQQEGFCDACFTGDYPTALPARLRPRPRCRSPGLRIPWCTKPRCPESEGDRRRSHLRGGWRGHRRRRRRR
ncbi:MAG TPA: hypothetical protein VGH31_03965, partial [Acidimicrobiales bacterium]